MISTESIHDGVAQITESVFGSMLALELARRAVPAEPCAGERMTGLVQITGSWTGAVSVECSERMARTIAGLMFGTAAEASTADEMHDALGELANMVGGNFKSMLEPPVQLALPSVTAGVGYRVYVPGSVRVSRLGFAAGDELIVVSVFARQAKP